MEISQLDERIKSFLTRHRLIIGLLILLMGIDLFAVGLHNMDTCQDVRQVQCQANIRFIYWGLQPMDVQEQKVDGKIWTLSQCYLSGMRSVRISIAFIIIGSFILGTLHGGASWIKK